MMNQKLFRYLSVALSGMLLLACQGMEGTSAAIADEASATVSCNRSKAQGNETVVPAEQGKYYLTAAEDYRGKLQMDCSALTVYLQDSKFYAVGERVLSVAYTADNRNISSGGRTVTMTWASQDPLHKPIVQHAPDAAEFGLLCLPGSYTGVFTVKTNMHEYAFTRSFSTTPGAVSTIKLDFAAPDTQPTRRVGILGDSISSFAGALCCEDFAPYYPSGDPNVGTNPSIAVDSQEKTYWWRLVYEYMKHGEIDANNSWSGSRVVHEFKTGQVSRQPMAAGFVDRLSYFNKPDIILIHGGTNDNTKASYMGEFEWDLPSGQHNLNAYRSAYVEIIKKLLESYEGVKIIILVGDSLGPYAAPTIQIAQHFNLPYVDFNGVSIEKCSGCHPTARGFETMANLVYNSCKDYLP